MKQDKTEFEREAEKKQGGNSLPAEFWCYVKATRKWWMLPIIIILAVFGCLMLLSGTGIAPFIYTLF